MPRRKTSKPTRDLSEVPWEIVGSDGSIPDEAANLIASMLLSIVDEEHLQRNSPAVERERSMPTLDLVATFKSDCPARDNFLSRVFGMFSEEPVRFWAEMDSSPYRYIGRPTVWPVSGERYSTLDFALERRADGQCFIAEMKCELAFDNYRYMTLTSIEQIKRHARESRAFVCFLEASQNPNAFTYRATNRQNASLPVDIAGTILVWGRVSDEGKKAAMETFGFTDVLSVEAIINELLRTKNERYVSFLRERHSWCKGLFAALAGSPEFGSD